MALTALLFLTSQLREARLEPPAAKLASWPALGPELKTCLSPFLTEADHATPFLSVKASQPFLRMSATTFSQWAFQPVDS